MKHGGNAQAGSEPAPIAPVPADAARATISVVIPTYEPEDFLLATLRSVLAQDPGSAVMQIAIVDDGSKHVRVADLLADIAPPGRIECYDGNDNVGLAGNWNRAIALARGQFVHVLHQDDIVHQGFYGALLAGLQRHERIGMAFCRHAFIDAEDGIQRISHRERWRPGVLTRWLDRIAESQRIQCPSAIVRRDVYEALGGFRSDLRFALDWEMWVRIASHYDVWYEPRVLASYRRHGSAETARLEAAGRTTTDMAAAIEVFAAHLPAPRRAQLQQRAYQRMVRLHVRRASRFLKAGSPQVARRHAESARIVLNRMTDTLSKRWFESRLAGIEARLSSCTSASGQA